MKQRIRALRYLISALAVSAAFSLVCFAQQAAGGQQKTAPATAQAAPAKEFPTGRVEGLVAEWTRAKDYTKEYLDTMPEDGIGFKPTPEIRSFAEQMLHLASGNFGFASRLTGQTNPYQGKNLEKMEEFSKTKAALTKIVMESYDFMISGIKGQTDAKLDERVTAANTSMPRSVALAKAFEHQTHHRGQTTIYIRLKGVKPPNERLF
ncbi:MAG TPA: DinB family protein [Blastocatellia bacterium]|nr:DinB family protein [Blastocatellia bacterium]